MFAVLCLDKLLLQHDLCPSSAVLVSHKILMEVSDHCAKPFSLRFSHLELNATWSMVLYTVSPGFTLLGSFALSFTNTTQSSVGDPSESQQIDDRNLTTIYTIPIQTRKVCGQ